MAANGTTLSLTDLLNTRETAELLRISVPTLERMRLEGTGPAFIKLGPGKRARVVYRRSDLDSWLEGLRFRATGEYSQR